MHRIFRAVIFDLDGLLADSEPWWNQIDAKLLAEYGVTYRGEYHRDVLGVSYRLAIEFYKNAFHISAPVEELIRRRGEIATEFFANRVGLFPSAKVTLERLREMKLYLALAASAAAKAANMRVAAIPDTRFVDPREYTKEADYVLRDLSEIPALIRRVG